MTSWEKYMASGHEAGCPRDQMRRFAVADIVLQPRQLAASAAARLCDAPERAAERGRTDAQRDLQNGLVKLQGSGLSPTRAGRGTSSEDYYERLLRERCGVVLSNGGCVITPTSAAYDKAYNHESREWVRQKYGTNIFAEVRAESYKQYELDKKRRAAGGGKLANLAENDYRVQPGDTFAKIAKLKKIPLRELMNANPGIDPKKLQINQKLVLPK